MGGRTDGRTNRNYEWCMNGWLELKSEMYPVSFNAVFFEMVTFGNNNNNNNDNNDDDDNNNNYYYNYYNNFF